MANCWVLWGYDKSGDKDRIYNIFSVAGANIKTETRAAQHHFMEYKGAIFNLIYYGLTNLKNVNGLGGKEISDNILCIVNPIHCYSPKFCFDKQYITINSQLDRIHSNLQRNLCIDGSAMPGGFPAFSGV